MAANPMHWLQFDVSGLAGKPGSSRRLSASGSIPGLAGGMGRVDDAGPVYVDATMTSREDGIDVKGRAWGRFDLSCSRCLLEYAEEFGVNFKETYYYEAELADERDGYEISGQTVDLEPMLRDAIVLSIPIRPVHSEDCRGLCTMCGTDLNVATCEHVEEPTDIRWAPLAKLFADEL
jgi:uncharacterized protein